jgi:hypothetical protein
VTQRRHVEAALAALFAIGLLLVGGGALWFLSVMPVHGDPAYIPSTGAVANAGRYAGAVEASRRLARSLLVEDNLPAVRDDRRYEGSFRARVATPAG